MSGLQGSWDDMSGRERVRAVVETMGDPMSVIEIADRAEVARSTADDELERLSSEDRVYQVLVDGKKGYDVNRVWMLFDEIRSLIAENTQDELAAELADLTERREELEDEFGVSSVQAFREQLVDDDNLSSEELRERRNVLSTWEALDTSLMLVRHALRMYEDVSELDARATAIREQEVDDNEE